MGHRVVSITSEQTHDLRARVLRAGRATVDVVWPGDDLDSTEHLGIVSDDQPRRHGLAAGEQGGHQGPTAPLDPADREGRPLAISTWIVSPAPEPDDRSAVQLRGMATDPAFAGNGFGSRLLEAGVARARAHTHAVLWANARVTALGFYERHGFEIVGPEFVTPATGLPHRLVILELGG